MVLQARPCARFDQMRQPLLAADIRPAQPSEILVAEHGKILQPEGSPPRKDRIHHKLAGSHG